MRASRYGATLCAIALFLDYHPGAEVTACASVGLVISPLTAALAPRPHPRAAAALALTRTPTLCRPSLTLPLTLTR